MHSWPQLESLTVRDAEFGSRGSTPDDFFACSSKLKKIELVGYDEAAYWVLPQLPDTVRTVKVQDGHLFLKMPKNFVDKLPDNLASQLEQVSLLEAPVESFTYGNGKQRAKERGSLDRFIAALERVKHLALSLTAISDIASLSKLPYLTDLELRLGDGVPWADVKSGEFVELLRNPGALKRVCASKQIRGSWSDQDRTDFDDALAGSRIDFDWLK